jgi:hypothetical protein
MVFKIDFNQEEIERLYLTYQNNPQNYTEIKKRLFGKLVKSKVQKSIRSRALFIFVLSIVAIVGSSYAYFFAEHWGSFGAIWIIWAGFALGIGSSIYFSYKNSILTMRANEQFFQDFEQIAEKAEDLDDFKIDWNTRG